MGGLPYASMKGGESVYESAISHSGLVLVSHVSLVEKGVSVLETLLGWSYPHVASR